MILCAQPPQTSARSSVTAIKTIPIKLLRSLRRLLFPLAVFLSLVFVALVVTLRYAVLPNIERYRGDIMQNVSSASGMAVSAGELRAGWQGLRPYIELNDVRFADAGSRDGQGVASLQLPHLHASLSWWALLIGEIRFYEVILEAPELTLKRAPDGLIYFAGKPLNQDTAGEGGLALWLLEQPHLLVHNAALLWQDELAGAPPLRLERVDVRIDKHLGHHHLGIRAFPPRALAAEIEVRGELEIRNDTQQWFLAGTLFASAAQASLVGLRRYLAIPDAMREATGNVRVWLELDSTRQRGIRAITADLNVVNASAQFAKDLAPLTLASLAGRIEYRAEEGGFVIASKGLQFRTREGIRLSPADFSLALSAEPAKPSGEVTGNGIDLKVIAALLNYFPVGKDLRDGVARFAPRGFLNQAALTWTGELTRPETYRVRGSFNDFALNPDGKIPGVQGLSGSVDGDERGGQFLITSRNLALDIGQVFRAPLVFDTLDVIGKWKRTNDALAINFDKLHFTNAAAEGEISGSYRTGGKGPGIVDLNATLARGNAVKVADYLPNAIEHTRDWLDKAIQSGGIASARLELTGDLGYFPFKDDSNGRFRLSAKVNDVRLKYLDNWPAVDNIRGEISFSGARISVAAESAAIYGARVGPTSVDLDDTTSSIPVLSIKGSANAPAQDVARFLQNSPLAEGVGKFTQVLTLEGPGKLDLSLLIPIGGRGPNAEPKPGKDKMRPTFKASGHYELAEANAKPPVGAVVTGVSGAIQFTERSVQSKNLGGTLYGNPLRIAISGGAEEGVVAELAGRGEVQYLNDILPFRLPAQITGVTDWKGRISAKFGRTDLVFESEMLGVASTLPAPLAKRADEPMKLTATFTEAQKASERIEVALGSVAFGRFARKFNDKGEAVGLAGGLISLEKPLANVDLPEGLWLVGDLRDLDIDHWKATFAGAAGSAGSAANSANPASSVITGFDLAVGKMQAFGREFKTLQMKGRRAGDDWRVTIDSPELSGDALWRPTAEDGRGFIRARLSNFVLNAEQPGTGQEQAEPSRSAAEDFPTLDVIADRFHFRGYDLGKLEFKAATDGSDWRIDRLVIEGDGSTLETSGRWTRTSGASQSQFSLKVDSSNLNGLMRKFGHGEVLRRGNGRLEGTLSWPGYPYQFALNNLSGNFKVEARKGEFAKIEPGAGRLLGLLSLQSIPRRFTLDFRDLFSEGFAFDRIDGSVTINRGVMHTDDFEIVGPSAFVAMQGDVSLPNETQNLRMTVIPSLGGGVSLLTGFLINPAVGLGALVVNKILNDPVGRAAAYQYNVTGTWEKPDVVRTDRNQAAQRNANDNDAPREAGNSTPPVSQQNKSGS
jgi:uncharacterized protein (TIGR02099 family)